MTQADPVTGEFLAETLEQFVEVDRDLVTLEQVPDDAEAVTRVFRALHTLKGTSGFLAFTQLEQIAHAAESLLGEIRDRQLAVTPGVVSSLLSAVDAIREQLHSISATGAEAPADYSALVASLTSATLGADVPRLRLGEKLVDEGVLDTDQVVDAAFQQQLGDSRRLGEILVEDSGVDPAAIVQALGADRIGDASVRIAVTQLDALLPIIAELVEVRARIEALASDGTTPDLGRWAQRLSVVTHEAQDAVMRTRLQPISRAWNAAPRIARDVAAALGKQVAVEMVGGETELDRAVLEAVRDPLTHLVRNAVDHGIEIPAVRLRRGKPAAGTVSLRAAAQGGHVLVELSDDGGGIDVDRVLAAAISRGLVSAERARELSPADAMQLIFSPGLSTSSAVTEVSGRGVGMDVVRAHLERIGGSVEVTSEHEVGTTFRLRIPLTLAVIPAVLVSAGGRGFAVPQSAVVQLLPATEEAVHEVGGAPVHRWRGRLLPVVDVAELLGLPQRPAARGSLLVVTTGNRTFGLAVDGVDDSRDVVVKPLGPAFERLRLFAGATYIDEREVSLILDLEGVADRAGVARGAGEVVATSSEPEANPWTEDERLLVLRVGEARLAIPVALVARLDIVPAAAVERVGTSAVVQWRGIIIRLAFCADLLGLQSKSDGDLHHVVVLARNGRHVGLVVDAIVDVVDDVSSESTEITDDGVVGAAVVGGAVAGLLDYRTAVLAADPDFLDDDVLAQGRPA